MIQNAGGGGGGGGGGGVGELARDTALHKSIVN